MINVQLEQIEKLNKIINSINKGDFATAEDVAIQLRNQLQDEVDQAAGEGQKDWVDNYVSSVDLPQTNDDSKWSVDHIMPFSKGIKNNVR